jgi:hypothetical protein
LTLTPGGAARLKASHGRRVGQADRPRGGTLVGTRRGGGFAGGRGLSRYDRTTAREKASEEAGEEGGDAEALQV